MKDINVLLAASSKPVSHSANDTTNPPLCRVGWWCVGAKRVDADHTPDRLAAGALGDRAELAHHLPLALGHLVDVQPAAMAGLPEPKVKHRAVEGGDDLPLPPTHQSPATPARPSASGRRATLRQSSESASTTAAPAGPPTGLATRGSREPARFPTRWDSRRHRPG